jgi:hypothetical protein
MSIDKTVQMLGAGPGFIPVEIPSNYVDQYKFLTIINMTDNSTCVYPPTVTAPLAGMGILPVEQYMSRTLPIVSGMKQGFNIVWTNPLGTNLTLNKPLMLIFSEENLGYNQSFASSLLLGGNVQNCALVIDTVGLNLDATQQDIFTDMATAAAQAAIAALLAGGLPAALTARGGLKVGLVDKIPAGDQIMGLVGIDQTTPGVSNAVSVSGSNTRKRATATITIGTGAAHSAGDVVSTDTGAILTFATGLPAGTSGIILDSITKLAQNVVFAGGAGYTIYLFNTSPTAQATNAVFDLADADLPSYIGKITIGTLLDLGSNCAITDVGHNLSFNLATGETNLYGKAVCLGAETTVSGKVLSYGLGIAAR